MKWRVLIVVSLLFALSAAAEAFINPSFTPVDLIQQSELVLLLEFKAVDDAGEAVAGVQKVIKGDYSESEVTIDLLAGAFEAQGRLIMALIAGGNKQSLLFAGMFEDGGAGSMEPQEELRGFLHLAGQWVVLARWEDIWEMEKTDAHMLGTWAGSTDMLLRAVDYILSDPDADVPVRSGVNWAPEVEIAKLDGAIHDAQAVDVTGEGRADLFLACERGDRIFRFQGTVAEDVTAKHGLTSRSVSAAWGDFNGDGRLDLASWDGTELTIHSQQPDGTFAASKPDTGDALQGGCLALTTIECGGPALLASTGASPVLLVPQPDGGVQARALLSGEFPGQELGEAGRCFVADFDDDGTPDVLQLLARGGLFYKGTARGEFAAPMLTRGATGGGRYGSCLGDYDADGLIDVAVAGEARNRIWHNLGGGRFSDMLSVSGEIAYISKPGGIAAQTGDFNNDGRQDVFIAYGTQMSPHLFFNRGFRSFGHARMVDLMEQRLLPQAGEGQQAGCLADFTGDGALDMLLVLRNGECWVFPRKVEEESALAAVAALSPASPHAGPVTVWAWRYERPLGAWPVRVGEPGAFIGLDEAGPVTVKWRMPGGEVQETEVIVEDGPVRVLLDQQ